ncbi:anthranilate synthase component I family protein [Nocardioides zeae]|uniref:Anthranilate synthase component I family protein n=1 Tax=Nocardioides imazamoxiresistens TaxID=3231893 RepID=A0ABU3PUB8_9ACTN|nr:anthranilate synthase component I family protein [Nocardioides zeae]MDT9592825.1 anthranilate synthase component I family protein [Nocardioides zeae]
MTRPDRDPAEVDLDALVAAHPRCVWLDGGAGREWSGRTSWVAGLDEDDVSLTYDAVAGEVVRWTGRPGRWRRTVVGDDPFAVLAAEVAEQPRARWFGYLGYAARRDLPALLDADDPPEAVWLRPSRVRRVEHPGHPGGSGTADTGAPGHDTPDVLAAAAPTAYRSGFERVQEALHAGDSYEVNLTLRHRECTGAAPAEVYRRLRAANPAPYAGFLAHDVDVPGRRSRAWLASSSPERYARLRRDAGGVVLEAKPMKGTAPRGADAADDAARVAALRADTKVRAENLMIVDLLRNDVGSVSDPGTVEVPELMEVETYAGVHQLVSSVRGRLRAGTGVVDAVRALFPAGSMTGAPKLRTMEVVAEAETSARGPYAGAFGWLDGDGADLAVVIRSLTSADGATWSAGTGGGITVRSDLDEEWAEAGWKLARVVPALRSPGRPSPPAAS